MNDTNIPSYVTSHEHDVLSKVIKDTDAEIKTSPISKIGALDDIDISLYTQDTEITLENNKVYFLVPSVTATHSVKINIPFPIITGSNPEVAFPDVDGYVLYPYRNNNVMEFIPNNTSSQHGVYIVINNGIAFLSYFAER